MVSTFTTTHVTKYNGKIFKCHIYIYIYIYIYCGWGEAEDGMETVGLARGGKKAHLRINPGSTYRLELEEER